MEIITPTIIVGHFGSGKTEFAANYALYLKEQGYRIKVADLDIVNPYFRIREVKESFGKLGIDILSSNLASDFNVDTPALAAGLKSCFTENQEISIVDVGGNPEGANVLGVYSQYLDEKPYNMWITINANRPGTSDVSKAVESLRMIEEKSKLKINGLINTTHMLDDTTASDIYKGNELIGEVSEVTGINAVYTVIKEELLNEVNADGIFGELFPIKILVKPYWIK